VITQMWTGLHQRAGTSARTCWNARQHAERGVHPGAASRSPDADALARLEGGELDPPCLDCAGIPEDGHVMFAGTGPVVLGRAAAIARACAVMVAVGTSLQVYRGRAVAIAADGGARLVIVNASRRRMNDLGREVIRRADRDRAPPAA